jgi:hypothetical protein
VIGSTTILHACISLWVRKYEKWTTTVRKQWREVPYCAVIN